MIAVSGDLHRGVTLEQRLVASLEEVRQLRQPRSCLQALSGIPGERDLRGEQRGALRQHALSTRDVDPRPVRALVVDHELVGDKGRDRQARDERERQDVTQAVASYGAGNIEIVKSHNVSRSHRGG